MLGYLMTNKIIGPDVWGPVVWHALHYITLGYPTNPSEEKKQKYKQFFTLLTDVIPCSICANHYSENLLKMPLSDEVLSTKESLIKWLIDVHNVVNEKNNKPIIQYEEARQLIEKDKECKHKIVTQPLEENTETNTLKTNNTNIFTINNVYYLFGFFLIIVFITFMIKKKI
jgi:uncharacterized protein YjcR